MILRRAVLVLHFNRPKMEMEEKKSAANVAIRF
jgi:hypothetical protein